MKNIFNGAVVLAFVLLQSCESANPGNENAVVKNEKYKLVNQYIINTMKDAYLWSSSLPQSIAATEDEPSVFLKSIAYKDDRYSFIVDWKTWQSLLNGTTTGHGFSLGYFDGSLYVILVYPNSIAEKVGIKRGDKIIAINGKSTAQIENISAELNNQSENTFDVQRPSEVSSLHFTIGKSAFTIPSVFFKTIITESSTGKKIGYMLYNTFLNKSDGQLEDAYTYFHNGGIQELIVDLRYNTGGYVSEAIELGSWIVPSAEQGKAFVKTMYNEKYFRYNDVVNLKQRQTLGLSRVFFLTSINTASASELAINGLKPYMNVLQIGTATYGKPVGSQEFDYYQDYAFLPIIFEYKNGNNEGGFFNGIAPNYTIVQPIPVTELGSRLEALINVALYYIANDRFPEPVALRPVQPLSEEQAMERLFANEFEKMKGIF